MQANYKYVELNKIHKSSLFQPVNFYGVLIDANYPYKSGRYYICCLKIIDPNLNCKNQKDYAEIVIFAYRKQDLPFIQRIGDIIRIHGANVRVWKGKRQFNVNVYHNSSWVLYSSDSLSPFGD